jgi:NAD(P)H-flavin reductase
MAVILVPAAVTHLRFFEQGEIRLVELTMPHAFEIDGRVYPIIDDMRAGTAFLAEPFGARTQKRQRRLYTRSNCSLTANRVLQTIINDTHDPKADTSIWWQKDDVKLGDRVNVRVEFDGDGSRLVVYEHKIKDGEKSLKLEPDDWWLDKKFVGIGFSTGITPLLAHVQYLAALGFGRTAKHPGAHYVLIVSVKNPRQLMFHEELLQLEKKYPDNFRYHPVLTREWPDDWPYTRGRIVKAETSSDGRSIVTLDPLFRVVPDIAERHVRMCGNETAESQLRTGFVQTRRPASFKAEVW